MTNESEERFSALVRRNRDLQALVIVQPSPSKLKSSSISNSFFSTKLCSSCVQPLGLFLSRGSCCPKCGLKVCKKCKIYEVHSSTWCCLACYKIMKHGRGRIVSSREDPRSASIKRSFSISETSRSSPVLKSYTKYYEDRPYNSLPRMASRVHNNLVNDSSPREGGGHRNSFRGNSTDQKPNHFQSTLHPFRDNIHGKKSPSSSVNFIDEEYWDYYDYATGCYDNSNRSSCERSLGETETVDYQHCVPRKPERSRKSRSMGAFDAKYSQLKSFCVITKDPNSVERGGSYSSLPRKPKKMRSEFEKENNVTIIKDNKAFQSNEHHHRKNNGVNENITFGSNTNITSSKNRSIINVKQDIKHDPQMSVGPTQTQNQSQKDYFTRPNGDGKPKTYASAVKSQNYQNTNTPYDEIPSSNYTSISEPLPSSTLHKNPTIHSSLRKNKYMDFYNGFTNNKQGSGSGLYFSLPPMRDRENLTSLSKSQPTGIEREIPIQFSNSKSNTFSTNPVRENPYAILEKLKRNSEELQLQSGTKLTTPVRPKSFTMPKQKQRNNNNQPEQSSQSRRGGIPLFTMTKAHNDLNTPFIESESILTSASVADKAKTGSTGTGAREVIIVIERECDDEVADSCNLNPNKNKSLGANENSAYDKSYNNKTNTTSPTDCDLIERGRRSGNAKSSSDPNHSVIVTPTPNESNNVIAIPTTLGETKSNSDLIKSSESGVDVLIIKKSTSSRNRNSTDNNMDVERGLSEIELNSSLSSSSSSTSSFLSNLDNGDNNKVVEDFGGASLVFHDCAGDNETDFVFKSCEEDENGDSVDLIGGHTHTAITASNKELQLELPSETWKGGIDEQVRGTTKNKTLGFSPGSEASSCTSTSTNSTGVTVVKSAEGLLLSQPNKNGNVTEENMLKNMVTTEPTCVVLSIPTVVTSGNNHQEMSFVRSTASTTTGTPTKFLTKKFKSRVLVNADCGDYEEQLSEDSIVTNVEIIGDQVGILTGRGTFIRPNPTTRRQIEFHHDVSPEIEISNNSSQEYDEELLNNKYFTSTSDNDDRSYHQKFTGLATTEGYYYNNENGSRPLPGKIQHYNEKENAIEISASTTHGENENLQIENIKNTDTDSSENCKTNNMSSSKESSPFSCRRESPEGEESDIGKTKCDTTDTGSNDDLLTLTRSHPDRTEPDGADKSSESSPTPIIEEPMEEDGESTDSWTEEPVFEDDDEKPPPLDLTLHTIVEESCEESEIEPEPDIPKINKLNELEKYYNFTTAEEPANYEESEFSDTDSSLSFDLRNSIDLNNCDHFELETGRLENYFLNLGLNNDSDSVGSESDSASSVLENRKKVLKHHRRSAEYSEDDDECAFEQDGLDTIKKQRKLRRSSEDLLDQVQQQHVPNLSSSEFKEPQLQCSEQLKTEKAESLSGQSNSESSSSTQVKESTPASVSRSNSFTWSSDEEVNLMMSKLRHLIKNMVHIKKVDEQKNDKLIYLENELVRLMKNENLKNIVESISSDSEDDVYKLFEKVESDQPELLNKVMTHIGKRLSTWMKDTDEFTDDGGTMKCAPSISSDLNEDRFSWKGSFESTLAKRQSVGSTDSIDGASAQEGNELFSERSILRSSSLHHLATSQPILEECEPLASSLPRLNENHPVTSRRTKNALISHQEVKSGRYRPPGYFEHKETHVSTPTLSTFSTNQLLQDGLHTSRKNITIRGQIEFLMQYNYKCSTFELCIKQCRDLAAVDTKRGRSDPYVKAYLLPERAKSSKKKTKVKKNTLNPMFGEVLKFPVTLEELENRILWLTVWHSGMFGKNEFLGEVLLNLRNITFDDVNYKWFPLQEQRPPDNFPPEESQTKQSMVLSLALKWSPRTYNKGNLTILIKEAKGLKYIKNSCPSTFVKCSPINDKSKKQKTPLCRKTLNPVWNTTLTFDNIANDGIELAFYNYDLLNHELISSTKLDPDCDVWREMGRREGFWVEGIATFE